MGSSWADPWYKYFLRFFKSFQFKTTITNTLVINLYSLLVNFPLPIIMALMINQMYSRKFKRIFQTITYMPHFISTVVMVGLIMIFLSPGSGFLGNLCNLLGFEAPNLMGKAKAFTSIYVWSDAWQHTGWDSIIYIAALSTVDTNLYEAATIDGASKWQKLRYIDIPMIIPTASILLIMRVGNLMSLGFEKVYLMQNGMNLKVSEIISTYVYKSGLLNAQYSFATAVGLFNSTVNLALLLLANSLAKKFSEISLF